MSDNRLRLFGHLSAGSESIDGKISVKALRGYSAYEIAVQEGFTGTEEEWLASMVGPQGPQGPEGPQGPQGIQGARGIQGESGKPISSIEKTGTDGYIDTYTITYNDSSTSTFTVTNGKNAEVEVWEDSTESDYRLVFTDDNGSVTTPNLIPQEEHLSTKADKVGSYDDLAAGTSKQLLSDSYTLDQVPYLFRKSPDSDRAVEEIVGGTVGWNQLVQNGDFSDGTKGWRIYDATKGSLSVSNCIATLTYTTAGEGGYTYGLQLINTPLTSATSHKYLALSKVKSDFTGQIRYEVGSNIVSAITLVSGQWVECPCICEKVSTGTTFIVKPVLANIVNGSTLQIKNVQLFDLTTMFGSTIADYIYSLETATAGAGVAKLKEWGFFTEDYYEYCEPTLRSVEGLVSKKTVGFNQWDGTLQAGGINNDTGAEASVSGYQRSDYIDVVGGSTYYCRRVNSTASVGRFHFYDAGKGYLGNIGNVRNDTFTVPANARYMRFAFYQLVLAENDICINLSDPTRNGQYEPYESHTYSLDSEVVLRGVPKLDSNNNLYYDGDVYPADGQGKRRYGFVDLGTLNYATTASGLFFTDTLQQLIKPASSSTSLINAMSVMYTVMESLHIVGPGGTNPSPNLVMAGNTSGRLFFNNTSYTDTATFKIAMSGVYLLYELATPTTFTAQPYHNPQIVGDTEEFVTTGIVPVGHATRYYQNLRKKIEGLPWNFSSLIAPTEASYVATRNYYKNDLFIVNNILYKALANIANGGTITPDTNCRATTLAEVIANL